jgi:hypothetical protein
VFSFDGWVTWLRRLWILSDNTNRDYRGKNKYKYFHGLNSLDGTSGSACESRRERKAWGVSPRRLRLILSSP